MKNVCCLIAVVVFGGSLMSCATNPATSASSKNPVYLQPWVEDASPNELLVQAELALQAGQLNRAEILFLNAMEAGANKKIVRKKLAIVNLRIDQFIKGGE